MTIIPGRITIIPGLSSKDNINNHVMYALVAYQDQDNLQGSYAMLFDYKGVRPELTEENAGSCMEYGYDNRGRA